MINKPSLRILLLSFVLVFSASTLASAQVSYGIKILSGQKIAFHEAFGKRSIHSFTPFGVGATINIPLTDKFGLQPELTYLTPARDVFNYHMLSLPVILTYQATNKLSIEAGPSLERSLVNKNNAMQDSYFKPDYNLGANLGLGLKLAENWTAGLRFTYEVFRTKYTGSLFSGDPQDPLIMPTSKREPGWRDTAVIASISYKLK